MKRRFPMVLAAIGFAALACVSSSAQAQKKEAKNSAEQEEEPKEELPKKSGKTTLEELKKGALAGDPRAQFFLGVRYYEGEDGLKKDPERAAEYFLKSSEEGFFPAHYSLGLLYLEGEGVEQSDKKAVEMFFDAADFGYAPAQTMLGALFEDGRGVEKDDEQAFKWYRRAAWQGDPQAQTSLGFFYSNGKGVDVDYRKSAELFRLAAEDGFPPAQTSLGQAFYEGKGVKQNFETAKEWYLKAAEQGHLWGLNNIAWLLATCEEEKIRDGGKAVEYARKAVDEGGDERFEIMDTLAAALARNGDFDEAAKVQEKAIKLLGEADDMEAESVKELAGEFEGRLKLYKKKDAFIEPAPEPVDEPEEGEEPEGGKPDKPKKGPVVA